LAELFRGIFSTSITTKVQNTVLPGKELTVFEKPQKIEKPIEIDPKDRIRLDTSDVVDAPLDLDFLKEMGIDESFVTGKKNE
jgi:hypothetical protein